MWFRYRFGGDAGDARTALSMFYKLWMEEKLTSDAARLWMLLLVCHIIPFPVFMAASGAGPMQILLWHFLYVAISS
jgi:hypothetical protein